MKLVKPWLPPIAAALAVVGLVVSVGKWEPRHPKADVYGVLNLEATVREELCEGYPWDNLSADEERILNVVLEEEGVYVGDECVPYASFRPFLIKNAKRWRPHHALIRGRVDGRFGHGVAVYETLWSLRIWPLFETTPTVASKRYPAVEVLQCWESFY